MGLKRVVKLPYETTRMYKMIQIMRKSNFAINIGTDLQVCFYLNGIRRG